MIAAWSRVFGFRSGPQDERFYACPWHCADLENRAPSDLFFPLKTGGEVQRVSVDDEIECDYCRAEDGPCE